MLFEKFGHIHQNAGRAVTALQRMMVVERFLQLAHLAVLSQAFDGQYFVTVGLDSEHQTTLHRFAVDLNGARPAYPFVSTANVGAGQPGDLTDEIHQQHAQRNIFLVGFAVDRNRDSFMHDRYPPFARANEVAITLRAEGLDKLFSIVFIGPHIVLCIDFSGGCLRRRGDALLIVCCNPDQRRFGCIRAFRPAAQTTNRETRVRAGAGVVELD